MLRIQYDGQYFDIRKGEQIVCEWVATLFNDEDEFKGSYTYPVLAPFTPKNNALLNHANRLENRLSRKKISVILEIFGQPWKKCSCVYTIGKEGYNLSLQIDNGEFASLIKSKELPQIFIEYGPNGIFRDWRYLRVGYSPVEVNTNMVDSARNPAKYPWVFFPIRNDGFWGGHDGDQKLYDDKTEIFNQYFPATGFRSALDMTVSQDKRFFTPFLYLRYVLREVCTYLGYTAAGDFFADPKTAGLVIDNTGVASLEDLFSAASGFQIKPAFHLPKMSVADFIKKVRGTFKMGVYFDANTMTAYFNYGPRILADRDAVDISGYAALGFEMKSAPAAGFELVQEKDDKDAMFKQLAYVRSFMIGETLQPKKVDSIAGTLFMTSITYPRLGSNIGWRIPRKRQVGNAYTRRAFGSEAYVEDEKNYTKNEFSFRLLNYLGMRNDTAGAEYPYASSDDLDADGEFRGSRVSLWLGGENGLIAGYHRDWYIFFVRTEQIELSAALPFSVLQQISPMRMLAWKTDTQTRIVALLNRLSFQASNHAERILAKVSVYPFYNQAATDEPVYTEFVPVEEVNKGGLYARFAIENKYEEWRELREGSFGGKKKNTIVRVDLDYVVYFFSDEAGTIPKNVENMPVYFNYDYKGANPRNYEFNKPRNPTLRATGSVFRFREQQYHYANKNDFWTRTYFLIQPANADYVII
ncbi:MAG: hypothetical protein INR69_14900 [Mucilaginibacter polytrichastri]|nr:hypothetical protein [Mucilaginibacter polytrichastri]